MSNRIINLLSPVCSAILFLVGLQTGAAAQVLNEIEIDPPSTSSEACQYTEVRGAAGSNVAANTYFVSVNSDAGNFGFANQAVNIGGLVFGSNGTITLINTSFGECLNRVYGSGTTRVNYFAPLRVGTGSETYLIVSSTSSLASGQDLDTDDNGLFDPALGINVLDGFALIVNPEEEYVYGAANGVVNISNSTSLDQPDAVTRFPGNNSPFLPGGFYFGELAASPDEATAYGAPLSANFPTGGILTPGDANAPAIAANVSISGRVTTPTGLGLRNAVVALTDSQGIRRTATTSSFGIYSFSNVPAGDTYIISVSSKRYRFTARSMPINSDLSDLDFIGLE